ncbi:fimbrial protein [Dyella sp. C9]|uniref:fimbrial protein n=1 Tax=Dyella sp. C9 TaxID=2202154 RepID=UPI000DEF51DF|nr:fimbrial protein [Dyella sp. C9]
MNLHRLLLVSTLLISGFLVFTGTARASCSRSGAAQTEDGRAAQIVFGNINLTDTYLQPAGTLLASVVVPPTSYVYGGASGSTVLWTCAATDLPNIYFLVATNGDDRLGGHYDIGGPDGLTGVYATWFTYVGLRQTMAGVVLSRYWQQVPVTTYATSGNTIQIRLQDIPPLVAELYRVSSLPTVSGSGTDWCGSMSVPTNAPGAARGMGSYGPYICTQPSAYIQLSGSDSAIPFGHDNIGEDSNSDYSFWGADNGFGYTLWGGASLTQNNTCVARNATPLVEFPAVSAQQLQAGVNPSAVFQVQIECNNAVDSGTASGQTAIGIQVSPGAYSAAQTLGLVNASGGVSYLVSDNYGHDASLASGVGIGLSSTSHPTMVFVGQPGFTGSLPSVSRDGNTYAAVTFPHGNDAGWYPVLAGAQTTGSSYTGHTNYVLSYTATLKRLPGLNATPGKVFATGYVLVKVQ